jgi:hypothetical protein
MSAAPGIPDRQRDRQSADRTTRSGLWSRKNASICPAKVRHAALPWADASSVVNELAMNLAPATVNDRYFEVLIIPQAAIAEVLYKLFTVLDSL